MTHTQTMRNQYATNKTEIQKILNWTPLQYAQYQEQLGYEYLKSYLQLDDYTIKIMSYEAMFWKWWINTWNIIDDQLMSSGFHLNDSCASSDYNTIFYKESHQVKYINTSPLAVQFDNTYQNMIAEMNEKIHQSLNHNHH
jgi:hypothetical protein